jgi:hypothetical protein
MRRFKERGGKWGREAKCVHHLAIDFTVMVCWRRYTFRKFNLRHSHDISASPSELILATRDCVIISNDAGGGEQDTTMTDEKWQQSVPVPRKEIPNALPSPSTSSDESISKPTHKESPSQYRDSARQSPQVRAKSPIISAFIDQRLEALRNEYPDLDAVKEYTEEGEGDSRVSLDSYCSYQDKEEAYTLARLQGAGPKFRIFANVLEVLAAEEDKEEEDIDSKIAHTGLTQTQTETGTQSQGGIDFGYF